MVFQAKAPVEPKPYSEFKSCTFFIDTRRWHELHFWKQTKELGWLSGWHEGAASLYLSAFVKQSLFRFVLDRMTIMTVTIVNYMQITSGPSGGTFATQQATLLKSFWFSSVQGIGRLRLGLIFERISQTVDICRDLMFRQKSWESSPQFQISSLLDFLPLSVKMSFVFPYLIFAARFLDQPL